MNDQAGHRTTTSATVASSEYPTMSSQDYTDLVDRDLAWSDSPLGEPGDTGYDVDDLPHHGNAALVAAMVGAGLALGSLGVVAFAYLHPAESAPVVVRPNAVELPSTAATVAAPGPVTAAPTSAPATVVAAPPVAVPPPVAPATQIVMRRTATKTPTPEPVSASAPAPVPAPPPADPAVPPPPAPVVVVNVPLPALPPIVVEHPLPTPPVDTPAPAEQPSPVASESKPVESAEPALPAEPESPAESPQE